MEATMRLSRSWGVSLGRAAVAGAVGVALALGPAAGLLGLTTPSLAKKKVRSTCSMYFVASVRKGPRAGTDYEGVLALKLDRRGRFRRGSFRPLRGGRVKVKGSSRGRAIAFSFPTRRGKLRGTGTVNGRLGLCLGIMEGGLRGPGRRNRGDWLAASQQSIQLSGGALLLSAPASHVIYRKPDFFGAATVFVGALNTAGNIDGQRLSARLNMPSGMDQDAVRSLIYVADVGNASIRRLNQSTGQVTTLLRSGDAAAAALAAGFGGVTGWEPHGVGVDTGGNLFISDARNHVIWFYNITTLKLKLLAGRPGSPGAADGIGTAARFKGPQNVGMAPDRTIANVVDALNCVVRQVTKTGAVATIGSATTAC
jgi:hypothetical protein